MLYIKKVATGFDANFSNQASSKEESFRCTWTLHVLLENPPGDYPDTMREEVLNGFCAIFSHIRRQVVSDQVFSALLLNPLNFQEERGVHFNSISCQFSELEIIY